MGDVTYPDNVDLFEYASMARTRAIALFKAAGWSESDFEDVYNQWRTTPAAVLSGSVNTPAITPQEAAKVLLDEIMPVEEHGAWYAAQDAMDKGGMVEASDIVIATLRAIAEDKT